MLKKLTDAATGVKARQWISDLLQYMPGNLMQNCRLLYRNKGNVLMSVGDAAEAVYLLVDGEVKIMNELPSGINYSFGNLHAPGILGENEVFVNFPYYRGTVVCEANCTFIYMTKDDFLAWMRKSPEALYRVTIQIIEKNASQVSHDRTFLFSTGENRLAYLLAKYYENKAKEEVCVLNIPRSQLADEIGSCVKTVDRCISKFKKMEMVGRQGMKITITKEQYMMLRNFDV